MKINEPWIVYLFSKFHEQLKFIELKTFEPISKFLADRGINFI
jgi:hypothetical protein